MTSRADLATEVPAPLLVGLGTIDRGDDAAGPWITQRVTERLPARTRIRVATPNDPSELLELWDGLDFGVVVDAVLTGQKPGTILLVETGAATAPLSANAWPRTARSGTHALGLAASIELARVLGRLPRRLVIVGVEAEAFEPGRQLSAPVAAGCRDAVDLVLKLLLQPGS